MTLLSILQVLVFLVVAFKGGKKNENFCQELGEDSQLQLNGLLPCGGLEGWKNVGEGGKHSFLVL